MKGTQGHPLTKWRLRQDPPWSVTYTAGKLGIPMQKLSKLTSVVCDEKMPPEVAFGIELITHGEIKMIDMLLTPDQQEIVRQRVGNGTQC